MRLLIQIWIAIGVSLIVIPSAFYFYNVIGLLEITIPMNVYRFRMFSTMAIGFIILIVPIVPLGILMYRDKKKNPHGDVESEIQTK